MTLSQATLDLISKAVDDKQVFVQAASDNDAAQAAATLAQSAMSSAKDQTLASSHAAIDAITKELSIG